MLFTRYRWVLKHLRAVLKPAIAFEFWSTLIFLVSFAPASAWLMNRLVASSGQYAVSDNDLLAFFASFRGILFLLLTVGFVLAFWFAEQAGLLIIVVKAARGRNVSVSRVLWENIKHLLALFRLGLLQAVGYLAAGIPFGFGIAMTYWLLLGEWDIYYYLNVQPLNWWIALSVAGTLSTAYLLLAAWLYIRWLFSIPALIFENATPTGALRKSWQQTRGRFREFCFPLAVCWLAVIISSLAMTWLISAVAARLVVHTGALRLLVPTVLGTLALITILDLMWFIIGKTVHVMLIACSYLETTEVKQEPREPAPATDGPLPTSLRRIAWLIATVVLLFMGIVAGSAFLQRLNINRTIEITAHRGSKLRAPENTLSALQQAIAEGADYAEIDVQTTADGVVVLLHDADLMRVASVNRRPRDIDYDELRDIDVGSWFAPEFSNERAPTLQEAIDLTRGRLKLNIELKFTWSDPALVKKVGHIIRHNGFASDCVVSSLNFKALTEIKRAFPELTTGFIVFKAVGNLSRMEADFLSISAARATPRLVREVHRRGKELHVWTVNDLSNALSMIEMGVDNIITDEPAEIRSLLEEWNALSDAEKITLMLRNLIVGIERPQPSKL
jgi:glycerophosphoryl diester phosphodiesterase